MTVAAIQCKSTAKIVRIPSAPKTDNSHLVRPLDGWRSPTIKDQRIIDEVIAAPGLTAREYGDRLGMIALFVNDAIYRTREGRQLAERGMIAVPKMGGRPYWSRLVVNKSALVLRKRVNQFGMIRFSNKIKGENRSSLAEIATLVSKLALHVSPNILKTLQVDINRVLIETGAKRAEEIAYINKIEQAA